MLRMEKKRRGRPPAGPGGRKSSTFPVVSLRLPPERKALLEALAFVKRVGVNELVDQALDSYVKSLPGGERKLAKELAEKRS